MGIRSRTRNRSGLTLVEVMIVVSIIGLIAVLVVPSFARARQTSLTTKCIANMRAVFDATSRYEMDHNAVLYSIRNNGATIRDTLLAGEYIRDRGNFDCPASPVKDFDDYLLLYANSTDLTNVSCTIKPSVHVMPP